MIFLQRKHKIIIISLTIFLLGTSCNAPKSTGQKFSPTEEVAQEVNPVSIRALTQKEFDGREFRVGKLLAQNESYTRFFITYKSGSLTISGIMNVPKGAGPFPVLILNHGYIDPIVYTNGRGLRREQDYFARRGYVVIHPDYRNHAQSDKDDSAEYNFRLGYVEDVINAILAIKNSNLGYLDKDRIGMLGHSMGGGVALNVMVSKPDLVKAFVLFAPVSADYRDNFLRWTEQRLEVAEQIIKTYGSPDSNPEFWKNISAINFLDQVTAPVMVHHGTKDESVPIEWSERLTSGLRQAGKKVTYHYYPNEPHEFTAAWPQVMLRSLEFFDDYVKR